MIKGFRFFRFPFIASIDFWSCFSLCTDLIRCAGRGHLTVDVLCKKFEIWIGHIKVKVIHASVTQKVMSKMQHFHLVTCDIWFGLCSVVLSSYSWKCCILLNTLWVMGACFNLTFKCPIQISNCFHKTSTIRCPLPAHLIKSVHIEKYSQATKTAYGLSRGQCIILQKIRKNLLIRTVLFSVCIIMCFVP